MNKASGLEIAVIGMAGRFPGANNINAFRGNLQEGIESVSFFSRQELLDAGIAGEVIDRPGYVKAISLLEGKEFFDAAFFGYLPGEARIMDPQIRIFHGCAWEALEDAGYDADTYGGMIGLYAGAGSNLNWELYTIMSGGEGKTGIDSYYAEQLRNKDYLTLRVSYKLNLRGPALFIRTTCSTSLAAVHMACRGLLTGESHIAIAGGVALRSSSITGYLYSEGMLASPDGHCRAFDSKAGGAVGGEGAAVVVLKKLKNAADDGDNIRAVIKGSAINNDGSRKMGFTAPAVEGQADVIRMACKMARVEPQTIGFIEAHGTGTPLGDPVEIGALTRVFGKSKEKYCALGSLKTNIGHLDEASGGASLIKTVLALQYKQIPPSLHFEKANPQLELENTPFYVNTTLKEWKNNGYPLRAGVSSFGIGGTNVHVVLEEYFNHEGHEGHEEERGDEYRLILLSAKSEKALEKMTDNLADCFRENPGINLADAAYTLQVGRKAFNYRRMLVCKDAGEAAAVLSDPQLRARRLKTFKVQKKNPTVVSASAGQGPGYGDMEKAGMQWLHGAALDWGAFYRDEQRKRISLPAYPFEKTPYPANVDLAKMLAEITFPPVVPGPEAAQKGRPELEEDYIEPASETEKKLVKIWQELFNIDKIGTGDNFFHLGGQSLKAAALVARVQKELDVEIPLSAVFKTPEIRPLARFIDETAKDKDMSVISLEPVEEKEYYPLSPAQKRLYILYRMNPGSTGYNIIQVVELEGQYDRGKMSAVCRRLIRRHESLRTSFDLIEKEPVQKIHGRVEFQLEYNEPGPPVKKETVIKEFIRPFDLSCAPLFRAGLFETAPGKYVLLVDVHHIVSDGFSHTVLVSEALSFYRGRSLPGLKLRYKDYAAWQDRRIAAGKLKEQEAYWLGRFRPPPPALNLPMDFPRPVEQDYEGRRCAFVIHEPQAKQLRALAGKEGATMFMLMLALFYFLLSRLSGREDIAAGTAAAGRGHKDLEQIIGMFVNTLVIRNYPRRDKTFKDFLREVRDRTLEAFDNQDYQFEDLVEKVVGERVSGGNPLFDAMFSFAVPEVPPPSPPPPDSIGKENEKVPAKFDILFTGSDTGTYLMLALEYREKLFKRETIERFINYFKEIVTAVLENENLKLKDFKFAARLSAADKNIFPEKESEFDF